MECDKIKDLIPGYFNHTASEEEIKMVEEHLCVCHDCRTVLGELMDREAEGSSGRSVEGGQQPAAEGQPDQMQIFSYDDIANIPQSEQPAKDNVQPDEEPLKPQSKEKPSSAPKSKKDMEYFPAKDFDDILKKPPEPVEGVTPELGDQKLPSASDSGKPLDREQNQDKKKEKIIQTPLGPIHASPDDEASEEASELPPEQSPQKGPSLPKKSAEPPEKKEKIMQTPLGPISLSSGEERSSLDQGINEELTEEKEASPSAKAPEKFRAEPKPPEKEMPGITPEPVTSQQDEIQEIGDKDFSFPRTSKFELDKTPIPSDKSDALGYITVALAIIALLFVVYLFLQMKG